MSSLGYGLHPASTTYLHPTTATTYLPPPINLKSLTAISKLSSKKNSCDCVTVRRCEDKYLNYYTLVIPMPQHHPFLRENAELGGWGGEYVTKEKLHRAKILVLAYENPGE